MTAVFEWLFKYRLLLYERGDLSFRPVLHPYLMWLLVIAALVCSYQFYRKAKNILPASWRYGLISLRSASFLIVILLLSQPVLRLHSVIPQENFVAVAYDTSRSMEIRDGVQGQSRLDVERRLLDPVDNPFLKNLASKFKIRYFRFSKDAERADAFNDTKRHGGVTNLERSLDQIAVELSTVPLAGVVLISDGADNRSANLDKTAARFRSRKIPIYAIGIGSSTFARDAEVLRVSAPRKVLKGTTVEAEVSIVSTGCFGRRSHLEVLDNERPIHNEEIVLGGDGEVKTVKVNFSSPTAGARVYRFRLKPFPDEVVSENNDQTILMEVEDQTPQVLYVEGEPRWEYSFLRRAILEDKNLRLIALLRQANGKQLRQGVESPSFMEKGFPSDKAEFFQFKAIILGSVEASYFTFDQLRMISDFVGRRGGGFLMLGGKSSFGQGGYANTPIEDLLPLYINGPGAKEAFEELEFKIRLTSYGFIHPVTRLSSSEEENRKRWDAAPKLMGFNPTSGPKPGATVLAQSGAPDSRGQSPAILAFQRFGRGKSMAWAAANDWRWKMGLDHADNMYPLFWKQMLRWLVSDAPDPVNATTDKHSYSHDDSIAIRVEANDASFLPINNAQVKAHVKSPFGNASIVPLAWDVEKDGSYSAVMEPQEEGIYEIASEAVQGAKSLGTAKTHFRVAESSEEFHNAGMNADALKRLTAETGGRYYPSADARSLPEDISYSNKGMSRTEEKDLWDMPFLFLLLVGLLATEWILRKRKGLA
jgi:uncharacterized membrane protein